MELKIKILRAFDFLRNINYQTVGSAGFDLVAATNEDIVLPSHSLTTIPAGIAIELPEGYEAQIRSRSGLAFHHQIVVFNAPATIDSDFRGEVCVLLKNFSHTEFVVTPGMRIAQMIIAKYEHVSFSFVNTLSDTKRGIGGFGSTGK